MSFFPIYLKLNRVLIIGGGEVAFRKLTKVLEFSTNIRVISKEFIEDFKGIAKEYNIELIQRGYRRGDLEGFNIVIVATDIELQREIFLESRDKRVLVNSVDSLEYCDFTFSSFIKRGDLVISISTGGIAPTFGRLLKGYIQNLLPNSIESFLDKMGDLRRELSKGERRMEIFRRESRDYFSKNFK